ncbi:hypothetical protein QUA30_27645 [Microcoleus sp. Pol14C2]|uniref:hypothetical protein n=1 Tax=unclassified Microcoleus TaxID=2642155 RepID=UPI002FD0B404
MARLLLSIFFGFSTFVVFILVDIPYALFLAAVAGAFELIPRIGAMKFVGKRQKNFLVDVEASWLEISVKIFCFKSLGEQ